MGKHKSISTSNAPEAYITINKSRVKIYSHNKIYMANETEFQLELDNCTSQVWLAMISLNGEKVSESGLVLKPGERVFLDTPDITSSGKRHKFKFETYEIEEGRSHLVAENGKVKVEFFKENIPTWLQPIHIYYDPPRRRRRWYDGDWYYPTYWYGSSSDASDPNITGNTVTNSLLCNNVSYSSDMDNENFAVAAPPDSEPNMEETGRIEKGSKSKQKFHETDYDFETFSSHTKEFHILPLSKKNVDISEATREYCTQCGKKRKKNFLFCPKCGTKF